MPLRDGEVVSVPREFRGSSRGALRAELAQFSSDQEAVEALHVWCADSRCNDAFTSFAVFMLDRAQGGIPLAALLSESYVEFERLLGASDSVDSRSLTGFVGELLVLLDGVRKGSAMAKYWAGPRGERHDFRNGKSAIEVKCSLRAELKAHHIHVSHWDQLEIPEGGELHLHSIRIERVNAGDWSVPSLLSAIRDQLDDASHAALDESLAKYSRALIDCPWEFSVQERSTYRVAEGFPRLVPDMLITGKVPGVSAVAYTLDLDHAAPFRTDWDQVLTGFLGATADA